MQAPNWPVACQEFCNTIGQERSFRSPGARSLSTRCQQAPKIHRYMESSVQYATILEIPDCPSSSRYLYRQVSIALRLLSHLPYAKRYSDMPTTIHAAIRSPEPVHPAQVHSSCPSHDATRMQVGRSRLCVISAQKSRLRLYRTLAVAMREFALRLVYYFGESEQPSRLGKLQRPLPP
jgi:hypothetical protein